MRTNTLSTLLLMGALVAAPQAGAELSAWDQATVTVIAGEISVAAQGLRDALRSQKAPTLGQPGRRAFFSLNEEMQVLVSASGRLHRALEQNAGQEETYPTYRRLLATARRAARETRRVGLGQPVTGKIDETAAAVRRIRPFYEAEPPL